MLMVIVPVLNKEGMSGLPGNADWLKRLPIVMFPFATIVPLKELFPLMVKSPLTYRMPLGEDALLGSVIEFA